MNWQEISALAIVAVTVGVFLSAMLRRRGLRRACGCAAGCPEKQVPGRSGFERGIPFGNPNPDPKPK